jgi:ubiquinone/menaquinone biosynthesis C-methylase UbiE
MAIQINEVRKFWDSNPCQSGLSKQEERRKYFEEITEKRYKGREWHVPLIAKFEEYKGKDVLEIGCGIGTDGFEFAKYGANYFGIDLTPNSIVLAKERFNLFGIKGEFKVSNAEESIPYDDNIFDHIYSFGVIHHSPNPRAIIKEMFRVLKPGGTFTVMLYNRSSINYYIEIMFLRKVFRVMLYPRFIPKLLSMITGFDEWKLNGHRNILIEKGKLSKSEWISINTDGPSCPLSTVYNEKEAAELFMEFRNVRQNVWEFNTDHWSFIGKLIPEKATRKIGNHFGWHRIICGMK